MNIFVLDLDIPTCASYHNDKHVVKQLLESTQMLSTACRLSGIDEGYKATHRNHPCNIWVRESLSNWLWTRELVVELHKQWRQRFNHSQEEYHKSYIVATTLSEPNIKDIGLTPFAQAMPNEYKDNDPVKAYRRYYMSDKRHYYIKNVKYLHTWKNRKPIWW